MWPADFFDSIGTWMERKLRRLFERRGYEFVDGIVRRQGKPISTEGIAISDISAWSIFHEMGFDVLTIVTNAGSVRWLDFDGTLVGILRREAPSKLVE
jgi:hypothetical protein